MLGTGSLEQHILQNLRQLTPEKQQEVLDFTEFLYQKSVSKSITVKLSLREIAAMPLAKRHQLIAQYIPGTAHDFLTDSELTEFSVLDVEGWENDE